MEVDDEEDTAPIPSIFPRGVALADLSLDISRVRTVLALSMVEERDFSSMMIGVEEGLDLVVVEVVVVERIVSALLARMRNLGRVSRSASGDERDREAREDMMGKRSLFCRWSRLVSDRYPSSSSNVRLRPRDESKCNTHSATPLAIPLPPLINPPTSTTKTTPLNPSSFK